MADSKFRGLLNPRSPVWLLRLDKAFGAGVAQMQAFPHRYRVKAAGRLTGDVELTAERLTMLRSASPIEFDGPGDRWSPETLLVGAVADCFILTFRAVANASKLAWISLDCEVTGTLDRVDHVMQFTRFDITARLVVGAAQDADRGRHALEKSERSCLISSSLKGSIDLDAKVDVGEEHGQASAATADGQPSQRR